MASSAPRHTPVQLVTLAVGTVFVVVGIAGFIPGITTHYGTMAFSGDDSHAMLVGLFRVSVLHNLVHLLLGLGAFALTRTPGFARGYLVVGAMGYATLWIYGLVIEQTPESTTNFVPLNTADDWLHLGLAILLLGAGIFAPGGRDVAAAGAPASAAGHA